MLIIWLLIFCVSLFVLIKAADYFTESAEKIGLAFHIPDFIVGSTIVTLGTTMPELGTSILAILKNQTEIVAANALGSNIANILLVIGLTAIVGRLLLVKKAIMETDLPLLAAATALMVIVMWDRVITFGEGLVAVIAFIAYIGYLIFEERKITVTPEGILPGQDLPLTRQKRYLARKKERKFFWGYFPTLVLSMAVVYLSSDWTVRSIISVSGILKVSSSLVAMIILALGTSMPELVIAITAVKKGKYEIALGNVFGANIFNALIVLGLPALFRDLKVDALTFSVGIPFLIGATVLYIFSALTKKITRLDGIIYLLIYLLFLAKLTGLI